jgi:hydrogenase nickel incorporation protein HypA/HybF
LHELAISENIISIILEHAGSAGVSKVTGINLTIGQLSGIVPDCVEFQLQMLSKGTIAEGAIISINNSAARLHCRKCDTEYSPDDYFLLCPNCGRKEFDILSGRECLVENIEVQ